MPTSFRLLTLGVSVLFAVAIAGFVLDPVAALRGTAAAPAALEPLALLPAQQAYPAEIAFSDTLQRGETLSQLLQRSALDEADAKALLAELSALGDPRRLLPGSVVSYRKSFASGDVRGMELKLNADQTLNVRREGEAWKGALEEVPVFTDTAVLAGEVTSSLYRALLDGDGAGVPAAEREQVADILADRIFAWQIDFSRDLRAGDTFRVLYERQVRPDGTARSGRVLGVQFALSGRSHEAYLYRSPDGREDYYAADGGSLRRAFLRAPLEFRRISSAFSKGRFHPILKTTRAHNGIDYAAASGTPVRATGDGVVVRAGNAGGYGNLIEIRHQRGYSSRYAHLRGFAKGVRAGAHVRQGDIIGYVGMTGLATGPHLHYEFHANGRPVDPNSIKYITGEPLPARQKDAFLAMVRQQIATMDRADEAVRLASGEGAVVESGNAGDD
jgi:murein DD-endopeptidase MepM/ murein hydrolase activator NlpD